MWSSHRVDIFTQLQIYHGNDDWWEETCNLTQALNCGVGALNYGVGANIPHTAKFICMIGKNFAICGQKNLPTGLTRS
jgi:hypothetical protein